MTNVAQDIVEETIKLTAADGHSFEAFHAAPKQGSKGGLVILQEIFGLTDQLKGVVRAYARDGYDTISPCVYDRVAPGTVVPFAEAERGRDLAYGLPLDKVMHDVGAAVDRVQSSRGVSVLGFSETHIYEAGHAFANDVRPAYNEAAATTARARTLDFLAKHHKPATTH